MTNFAETKVSDVQTFDINKAQILALELGYYQPIQTAVDAETIYSNHGQKNWRELRQFFVGQGYLPLNRFIKAMSLLNQYSRDSFTDTHEEPVSETTVKLGSVGIYAVETGYSDDSSVVSVADIPQQPRVVINASEDGSLQVELDAATPEELEAEATRLLEIAERAKLAYSTTPTPRKEDTGPWLRTKPATVYATNEPEEHLPYVSNQLPAQSDKELREEAKKNEDVTLALRQNVLGDEELEWQEDALCAVTDPEAFFPEKGGSTKEAKRVCASCDVRVECLDYALDHDERFGIWGGLSERERRKLKKASDPTYVKPAKEPKPGRKRPTREERQAVIPVIATLEPGTPKYYEQLAIYYGFKNSKLTTEQKVDVFMRCMRGEEKAVVAKSIGVDYAAVYTLVQNMLKITDPEMFDALMGQDVDVEESA